MMPPHNQPIWELAQETGISEATLYAAEGNRDHRVRERPEPDWRVVRHERHIHKQGLTCEAKLAYRTKHSEPVVKAFWQWCGAQSQSPELQPSNPLTTALHDAMTGTETLQVFLSDPDVPIDTNYLERAIWPLPLGRKNCLFCWTEIGAERLGVIVDANGPVAYLMSPDRGIDAVELSSDKLLWHSVNAAKP